MQSNYTILFKPIHQADLYSCLSCSIDSKNVTNVMHGPNSLAMIIICIGQVTKIEMQLGHLQQCLGIQFS
jgi:hypothetical protein